MQKLIRWPGLIAFFVITGLIAAIVILFLDFWIKLAAEKGLESSTGAEVNIAQVTHTFSPFGVTLTGIQLTDPATPTLNQVQADEVTAQIELAPLLLRKVIIDDLTISGVQFAQPRESEGAVYRTASAAIKEELQEAFDPKNLPSVDEILAQSPLKTTKAVEETQAAYKKHSEILKEKYQQLPSKDALENYKKRVETITNTDYKNLVELAKAKEEFDALRAEIQTDKRKLTEFKEAASAAKGDMAPKLAKLKSAPGEDYAQLQALIAGDEGAIKDVTTMVFGEKAGEFSQYVLGAYDLAAPMLASSKAEQAEEQAYNGRWVAFDDTAALPDFLVRNADISIKWRTESVLSIWHDITNQHDKIGRPTTFKVDSNASSLWQSLKLNGDFWLNDTGVKANQDWNLRGLALADVDLLNQEKLSSTLLKGLLSSSGKASINKNVISGSGNAALSQLQLTATGSNNLTNVIAETLTGLSNLSINSDISGTLGDMDLSFSSDLDKQLASAMLSNLSGDQNSKLAELKQKLNAKIEGPLGATDSEMSQWLDWEKLADGDLSSIQGMLDSKLNSVVDKKKDELKDKLKDKLKGKLFN
ncbi:MAG: TIGR03545 family protein [Paraglaciecola polaris]|uniref:TIGR03545 family protein n=1 Tax=Paraglaciecola polaris TaxID=222814 RepID=UPI0030010A33|tara:strand:- start:1366 stop:3129 length:1764 start_codon:yes stop_codon:yes gene_type:complete